MISAEIRGRLGNQMFIIAAAESLAIDNQDIAVFPLNVIGACPSHEERASYASTIFSKIKYMHELSWAKNLYIEPNFNYHKIPYAENIFLQGYFQSEKHFAHNAEQIKNLFAPTDWVKSQLNYYYGNFQLEENMVAVHVRRGDYVKLADVHKNLAEDSNYYDLAMQKFDNAKFVFFSDDVQWCQSHFGNNHLYMNSISDILDLYFMASFKNKIIANSSFSWWAAWLGEDPGDKIIAPKKWFSNDTPDKDVIPDRWERV